GRSLAPVRRRPSSCARRVRLPRLLVAHGGRIPRPRSRRGPSGGELRTVPADARRATFLGPVGGSTPGPRRDESGTYRRRAGRWTPEAAREAPPARPTHPRHLPRLL